MKIATLIFFLIAAAACNPAAAVKDFPAYHYDGASRTLEYMCSQGKTTGDCIQDPGFVDPDGADNIHGTVDDDYRLDPKKASDSICCENGKLVYSSVTKPDPDGSDPRVIEAEDMAWTGDPESPGGPGWGKPIADGWAMMGQGALTKTADFKSGNVAFQIIARGDFAGDAWPIMEIKVGGTLVASITVDSTALKTFTVEALTVAAGAHEVSLGFINDFYAGTPQTDRNLYVDKIIITEQAQKLGWVKFGWKASVTEGVTGYKLYYGATSRFDPLTDAAAILAALIEKNCKSDTEHEDYQSCKDSWTNYCQMPDLLCDYDWAPYDESIDVGNVFEYTLHLPDGKYFFALSSYTVQYEGKYSVELVHTVSNIVVKPDDQSPASPVGFAITDTDARTFIRGMFEAR